MVVGDPFPVRDTSAPSRPADALAFVVSGGRMALVITDDATPDQICEAIGHLRAKQRACRDQQVRTELGEDIDELLDALLSGSL